MIKLAKILFCFKDYEFVVYRNSLDNLNATNGLKIRIKLLNETYGNNFIQEGNLTLNR